MVGEWNWQNKLFHGQGREMFFEGVMRCGNFKKELYEGAGIITDLEGNERKVEYKAGEIVRWIN